MPSLESARELGERSKSKFLVREYAMRIFGMALGVPMVSGSLSSHGEMAWGLWAMLLFHGLVWPHLAYLHVRMSRQPVEAEYRNLTGDAAIGGFWIAMMGFDVLPSAILLVWMTMDKVIIGGGRFALRTVSAMAATCLVAAAFNGFAFSPVTSYATVLLSLPFLVAYPIALGFATRSLANKVHRQKRMLEHVAHFDAATGLANRQHWFFAADAALRNFRREGRAASLMMIDIDRFKEINDNLGHAAGDMIIAEFSELLKNSLREQDTPGRYGGDEFGVLMPDTSAARAMEAAERLRSQVERHAFVDGLLACTVSIGVAEVNAGMANVNEWLRKADSALYRAKSGGRNQVEVNRG